MTDITETSQTVAVGQLRAFVDRILRLKEEQDTIGDDVKEVYAEMKGMGFDRTAAGALVTEIRKKRKSGEAEFEERNTILDLYRAAYEAGAQPSHKHASTRTRENIEEFPPHDKETGEIFEQPATVPVAEKSAGERQPDRQQVSSRQTDGAKHGGQEQAAAALDHASNFNSSDPTSSPEKTDQPGAEPPPSASGANSGSVAAASTPVASATEMAGADPLAAPANNSDAGIPAFLLKDRKRPPLRPHCLNPTLCAGSGREHCHGCKRALAESEAA